MNLTLREMEVFRSVMERGGVTAAAAALHVSQPAVSRTLQGVEVRLGLTLFRRHRKRLIPTADALALYPHVVEAFAAVAAVGRRAVDLRSGQSGTLRIAAIAAFANALLPEAIGRFRQAHPGMAVTLLATSAVEAARLVLDNRADVAFVIGPVPVNGLHVRRFCRTEVGCLVPPGHAFAARRSVGPADLAVETLICLAPHLPLGALIGQAFAAANVPYRVAIEVTQSTIACELVRAGAGVALLDGIVATRLAESDFVLVPFRPALPVLGNVLTARDRPSSREVKAFESIVGSVVASDASAGRPAPGRPSGGALPDET